MGGDSDSLQTPLFPSIDKDANPKSLDGFSPSLAVLNPGQVLCVPPPSPIAFQLHHRIPAPNAANRTIAASVGQIPKVPTMYTAATSTML